MTPALAVLLVATFVVYAAYELWQASHREPTISEQVWSFRKAWPPILFLAGVLCGHLFT
jgi:hypothetical protein